MQAGLYLNWKRYGSHITPKIPSSTFSSTIFTMNNTRKSNVSANYSWQVLCWASSLLAWVYQVYLPIQLPGVERKLELER